MDYVKLMILTGNSKLGTGVATVSRYDPAGEVSTRQPVAFNRVRFPSHSAGLVWAGMGLKHEFANIAKPIRANPFNSSNLRPN